MQTLEEIEMAYTDIAKKIARESSGLIDRLSTIEQIEDFIFDEDSDVQSDDYLLYLQHLMSYAQVVKNILSFASELIDLKAGLDLRIGYITRNASAYPNSTDLISALGEIATPCEATIGRANSLGDVLHEKMLILTNQSLRDATVRNLIEVLALDHQDEYEFCRPWVNFHQNLEERPLLTALNTLPATLARGERRTACPG